MKDEKDGIGKLEDRFEELKECVNKINSLALIVVKSSAEESTFFMNSRVDDYVLLENMKKSGLLKAEELKFLEKVIKRGISFEEGTITTRAGLIQRWKEIIKRIVKELKEVNETAFLIISKELKITDKIREVLTSESMPLKEKARRLGELPIAKDVIKEYFAPDEGDIKKLAGDIGMLVESQAHLVNQLSRNHEEAERDINEWSSAIAKTMSIKGSAEKDARKKEELERWMDGGTMNSVFLKIKENIRIAGLIKNEEKKVLLRDLKAGIKEEDLVRKNKDLALRILKKIKLLLNQYENNKEKIEEINRLVRMLRVVEERIRELLRRRDEDPVLITKDGVKVGLGEGEIPPSEIIRQSLN